MRKIVTTSFSEAVAEDIKRRAKAKNISVSRYFLHLYEMEKNMISEDEIVDIRIKTLSEHEKGKTELLHSLSDLL